MKMSRITEEEKREIVIGFVQHVFEEIQVEGWKERRDVLLAQYKLQMEGDFEYTDKKTFNNALEDYKGNLDDVFTYYLYPILSNPDWVEAWFYKMRPDLDEREEGEYYWDAWDALYDFMYMDDIAYDNMKDVLGLNFDLK